MLRVQTNWTCRLALRTRSPPLARSDGMKYGRCGSGKVLLVWFSFGCKPRGKRGLPEALEAKYSITRLLRLFAPPSWFKFFIRSGLIGLPPVEDLIISRKDVRSGSDNDEKRCHDDDEKESGSKIPEFLKVCSGWSNMFQLWPMTLVRKR